MKKAHFSVGKLVAGVSLALAAGIASATPPATSLSSLTSAISFTDVLVAIMAVGVALVGLRVTIKGVKTVLGMIR
ncbi:hypothetical protein [Undibacterium sp. Ji22W]|uniref:hypothetical protein n=1 Tax=Undibacterium sp. Ji22W TaxID=3413038 RepID=UPI003BF459EB